MEWRGTARTWAGRLAWPALWLVVGLAVVVPHVHAYQRLSPIDETQHVDYLNKASHFHVVHEGDRLGPRAMRAASCRQIDYPARLRLPRCAARHLNPERYIQSGYNTTYSDPPLYYAVTGVAVRVLQRLPGPNDVVDLARGLGAFWLAGGLWVTFLVGRRLGAGRAAAAGATLLIGSTPQVVHASATVTSDAGDLVCGGVVILVALAVAGRRIAWWWLAPAAAVATFVKVPMLTVVGAAALYLLLEAYAESRAVAGPSPEARSRHRPAGLVWGAALALVAAVVPVLLWSRVAGVSGAAADSPIPMRHLFASDQFPGGAVVNSLTTMVTPVANPYVPAFLASPAVNVGMAVTNALLLVACVGLAWAGRWHVPSSRLAAAVTCAMVLGGPALVVLEYLGSHYVPGIVSRYGLSLVPAMAGFLAVAADRRRWGGVALVVLGSACLVVLLQRTL